MVVLIGVFISKIIYYQYELSRDENLVQFDSVIYASGRLVAHVAEPWRTFASALEPRFMTPIADGAAFISEYLPINAALRALFGLVVDPVWMNPIFSGLSVALTYRIGMRLWTAKPDAALVAALFVGVSSQVIITSATSYAMTGHLFLNLLWLALFLRGDRIGYATALLVGFLATGLHQAAFHPLFAAPFILSLPAKSRVRLLFFIFYAAFVLFWLSYLKIITHITDLKIQMDMSPTEYLSYRILTTVRSVNAETILLMIKNIIRFLSWNCILIIFFATFSCSMIRARTAARPLALGIAFTLGVLVVLMPLQGHGWGYRYMHGLIGSLGLLAGFGWIALTDGKPPAAQGFLRQWAVVGAAISFFGITPIHAWQVNAFVAPYARASDAIAMAEPDKVVVVDNAGFLFGEDLVRNDPFLRNGPKIMTLAKMNAKLASELCDRHAVLFFDKTHAAQFGLLVDIYGDVPLEAHNGALRALMAARGCGTPMPTKPMPTKPTPTKP